MTNKAPAKSSKYQQDKLPPAPTEEKTAAKSSNKTLQEDDAVAQFLLDLKLDDEE